MAQAVYARRHQGFGRPGTQRQATDLHERIRKQLELPAPVGLSSWDGATLAQALAVSDDAIWRILRKEGIQLRRMRSWCVSTDPEFAAKAADVIGLYLGPPTNALVLSVDEKPSIQAKVTAVKKRPDFQAFLDDVVAEVPPSQEVHVILDNYATHKKNDDWLARHPNVHLHFTPTSASWLNQVEIWFGIFTRKTLSGASFQTTEQLTQAIEAFVTRYNKTAAPFIWRKREVRGAQLRNTIVNLRN